MRPKVLTAFFLTLLLAAVCALPGDGVSAQRRRAQKPQPAQAAGAGAPAPQQERAKQVIIGRGSDTARGSRMTITSDNPLNDYSAYRSGDRFYVELPNADANTMARAAGKGFSDLQVQRRGKNVVLSYRVQPGAKPRVEQRFNRLDVVFEAPDGAPAEAARAPQQTPPAEETRASNAQNQTATQAAPPAQNPNADERRPSSVVSTANNPTAEAAQPSLTANAPDAASTQTLPTEQPSPVEQATPLPAPSAAPTGADELAQAQPPAATAPVTTTANRPGTQTGATVGAVLLRNWWMLVVAALLVLGIGLLFAARKTSAANRAPVEPLGEAPATPLKGASTARLKDASDAGLREASAVAATTAATFKKESDDRKKKKRAAKKKGKGTPATVVAASPALAATVEEKAEAEQPAAESVEAPAAALVEEFKTEETAVAETVVAEPEATTPVIVAESATAEPAAEESVVEEPSTEQPVAEEPVATATEAAVADVDEAAFVAAPFVGEAAGAEADAQPSAEVVTSTEVEPAFVHEPVAEVETAAAPRTRTEIAPYVALDPESVQAQARSLLDGADYDPNVVGTSDAMARQMIGAELLSALAGRNAERRERARVAFREHGYFDEKLKDLSTAEAAAERASAARALGLASDLSATPQLVNALEDDAVEVRRAAVESLASLRDPSAVEPLEALLRREQKSRDKVNRKLVEHAIQACREGLAETPAPVAAPPAEITQEAEAAPAVEETPPVEEEAEAVTPVEEAAAVEEAGVVEEVEAQAAAAEYPVKEQEAAYEEARLTADEEETLVAEPAAPRLFGEPATEATPQLFDTPAPATEAEPVEVNEATPRFEFGAYETESQPESLEVSPAAEAAQTTPSEEDFYMPSDSAETPAADEGARADEWVELDMSELSADAPSASVEPFAPLFETSGGEPVASDSAFAEPAETELEAYRGGAEEGAAVREESAAETFAPAAGPYAGAGEERGVELFDERSTVPAAIQHRLASEEPAERAAAVNELAHVDTGEAFQQICAAFDDDAKDVRSAAARALFELPGDRADSFTRALREASPERRRQIGAAINSSGLAADAISQLTGESREKTYEAFSLLFLMAKAGEVQPLIRAIEGHPSNEVRLAVVKLLALSGQSEILPAFRRLAVRGSLPTDVRSAVMEAIYQISSQQPTAPHA